MGEYQEGPHRTTASPGKAPGRLTNASDQITVQRGNWQAGVKLGSSSGGGTGWAAGSVRTGAAAGVKGGIRGSKA